MRKLIYSMSVSLDGYINDAEGGLGWVRVDEEYHRFANQQMRETGLSLHGTRMWQTMKYWDTADTGPDFMREFAELWRPAEKLVVSHTLSSADMLAGARLFTGDIVAETARLKAQPGGPIAVAGATLASSLIGLIDEIRPFFVPAITGGGTPFLSVHKGLDFDLVETHQFASGTIYHRYVRRDR